MRKHLASSKHQSAVRKARILSSSTGRSPLPPSSSSNPPPSPQPSGSRSWIADYISSSSSTPPPLPTLLNYPPPPHSPIFGPTLSASDDIFLETDPAFDSEQEAKLPGENNGPSVEYELAMAMNRSTLGESDEGIAIFLGCETNLLNT